MLYTIYTCARARAWRTHTHTHKIKFVLSFLCWENKYLYKLMFNNIFYSIVCIFLPLKVYTKYVQNNLNKVKNFTHKFFATQLPVLRPLSFLFITVILIYNIYILLCTHTIHTCHLNKNTCTEISCTYNR